MGICKSQNSQHGYLKNRNLKQQGVIFVFVSNTNKKSRKRTF